MAELFRARGPEGEVIGASGLEPDALLLLGETYLKMHKWNEARSSFATILQQYPRSALTTSSPLPSASRRSTTARAGVFPVAAATPPFTLSAVVTTNAAPP